MLQLAIDHVEVGPAHSAGFYSKADLAQARQRIDSLDKRQRQPRLFKDHRFHGMPTEEENAPTGKDEKEESAPPVTL
jgi:hypothetical protein